MDALTPSRQPGPAANPAIDAIHIHQIDRLEPVVRATVYRAVLIPPGRRPPFRPDLEPPRFDVTVLIETDPPGSAGRVAGSAPVVTARNLLRESAARLAQMQARCVRAIADVDKRPAGIYLFNFWAAADTGEALEIWEHFRAVFHAPPGALGHPAHPRNRRGRASVTETILDAYRVSVAVGG